MVWQKRISGNCYDSLSGHGVLIVVRSKKVIDVLVMFKQCGVCMAEEK